ncbi:tpr domain protein in aerotolerance operon batb [Anaeramoeba flamelloides]|uniref:Tpr domain protein in aerotolerance operon batb n=1 Tax=Anaeramoeba flamelloides TaxID=1746091 RepID=A0ABQ8XZ44_9EUKA|nr:tpr domain protein in aerotolerance operon batb [Anaeramoeba flamelloides]
MGNIEIVKRDVHGENVKKYLNKIKNSREAIGILTKEFMIHDCNRKYVNFFGCGSKKEIFMYGSSIIKPRQDHLDMLTSKYIEQEVAQINIKNGVHDFYIEYSDISQNNGWAHVWVTSVLIEQNLLFQVIIRETTDPYNKSQNKNKKEEEEKEEKNEQEQEQEQEQGQEKNKEKAKKKKTKKSDESTSSTSSISDSKTVSNTNSKSNSEKDSDSEPKKNKKTTGVTKEKKGKKGMIKDKILPMKKMKKISQNLVNLNFEVVSEEESEEEEIDDFVFLNEKVEFILDTIDKVEMKNNKKEFSTTIKQSLEKIAKIYKDATNMRDQQIKKMSKRLQSDRMEYKNKYDKLELHFKRRLGGLESEQKSKENIEQENEIFQEKLERLTVLIKEQTDYQTQISKFI